MKRLLIILFVILLLLAGCSTEAPKVIDVPETHEVNEDSALGSSGEENEPVNDNENTTGQQTKIEEQPAEEPSITEEPVKETQEPVTIEETVITEGPSSTEKPIEESEDAQEGDNNVLKIKGLLENELKLTLNDLKAMKDIIFEADFYSLNSYGTTGYTHFKGVKLWELLEKKALIKPEAAKITITAQDGYSMEFTIEQVKMEYMDETNPDNKYPMIIAWDENDKEYSTDDGAPYKLVVGQKEPGDVNKPQWVSNIDVIVIE